MKKQVYATCIFIYYTETSRNVTISTKLISTVCIVIWKFYITWPAKRRYNNNIVFLYILVSLEYVSDKQEILECINYPTVRLIWNSGCNTRDSLTGLSNPIYYSISLFLSTKIYTILIAIILISNVPDLFFPGGIFMTKHL